MQPGRAENLRKITGGSAKRPYGDTWEHMGMDSRQGIQDEGFRRRDSRSGIPDKGFKMRDSEEWIQDKGFSRRDSR